MKKKRTFKSILSLLALAATFFMLQINAIAEETLTNKSIIALSNAKVSKAIIIEKVKTTANAYDLTANGLIELHNAKVNDQIVIEMLLASNNLPVMVNQDVIDMQNGGVSRDVILKKIEYSKSNFNTDAESMIALKLAKVPEQVQKAMLQPSSITTSKGGNLISGDLPPHPTDLATPDIAQFRENGIFYENYTPKVEYLQLEASTTNQAKNGSYGESRVNRMTYGISGISESVGLANTSANMVIQDARPVFYFIFSGNDRKDMNNAIENNFNGVASPNDFVLVKAKVTKTGRSINIGSHSSYSQQSGFGKGVIPFRFKKIDNSMYKVYFDADIPAREYAFYYNKGSVQSSSLKLYDFSLKNNISK